MTTVHVPEVLDAEDARTPEWDNMRDQEKKTGTLPKGTYEATLREVAVVKRKDGGSWVIRMLALTDARKAYAKVWQGLSDNPEDPFDLTDAQAKSLKKFGERMSIPSWRGDGEEFLRWLASLLGGPVTVKITQTPVGQQAVLSRPVTGAEPAKVNGHREVSDPVSEAHAAHEKIVQGLRAVNLGLAAVAEGCHALHESEGWLALGHDTLSAYLASPEITISRTEFYRAVDIWQSYVLTGGVEPMQLEGAGPTKLELPLPALKSGVVSAEQAVADATSMTRKDLRTHYAELVGNDSPEEDGGSRRRDNATVPVEVGRTLTGALHRVLVEVGAPEKKRMSNELRESVVAALEVAYEHGLDGEL